MILSLIIELKNLVTDFFSPKTPPRIDSLLFRSLRFGYLVTAAVCVLVTARTYIGDNINCSTVSGNDEEEKAIESFCFISATFTLSNLTFPSVSAHPGLGVAPHREYFPPGTSPNELDEEQITRHSYYQWVPFMLVLQSIVLYLPWKLWDTKENDYLHKLLADTHHVHVDKIESDKLTQDSANFFEYSLRHFNTSYFRAFLVYEVFGVAVAIGNLFVTNAFLGGKFFYFCFGALDHLSSSATDVNNPLNEVFPKIGKCSWYMFGPTGSIVERDSICVLPLNIVNEKTYIFLCLAYIAVAVVASLAFLYHIYLYAIPGRLDAHIVAKTGGNRDQIRTVMQHCDRADKFILWNLKGYIIDFPKWIHCVLAAKKTKRN